MTEQDQPQTDEDEVFAEQTLTQAIENQLEADSPAAAIIRSSWWMEKPGTLKNCGASEPSARVTPASRSSYSARLTVVVPNPVSRANWACDSRATTCVRSRTRSANSQPTHTVDGRIPLLSHVAHHASA